LNDGTEFPHYLVVLTTTVNSLNMIYLQHRIRFANNSLLCGSQQSIWWIWFCRL